MAYDKSSHGSSLNYVKLFLAMMFLAVLGIIATIVWFGRESSTIDSAPTVRNGTTGEIAQLSGGEFSAGIESETQQQTREETPVEQPVERTPTLSTAPHTMDLPDGWTSGSATTTPSDCDSTVEQTVTEYTSGSKTISVYENGNPNGCDNSTIGDKYYDFSFSPDGSSITVDTSDTSEFCTKEDNPTCPKGDGKVTVFVGNITDGSSSEFETNTVTGKSYFFVIEDTNIQDNLVAQAASLATLAESIQIN